MIIKNKKDLLDNYKDGLSEGEYVLFWDERDNNTGFLSNWHLSKFKLHNFTYFCMAQYMMERKANLAGNQELCDVIKKAQSQKSLEEIDTDLIKCSKNINERNMYSIMVEGNKAKFKQNHNLKKLLLATNDKILISTNPYNKIWGIAVHQSNTDITNPKNWKGDNLTGFAIMEVRRSLGGK